jgi:hypothetical protein
VRESVFARPRSDGSVAMEPRNGCASSSCEMNFFRSAVDAKSSLSCAQNGLASGYRTEWNNAG